MCSANRLYVYAAADQMFKCMGWMRPPAPRQVVLAQTNVCDECALSTVPATEIEHVLLYVPLAGHWLLLRVERRAWHTNRYSS